MEDTLQAYSDRDGKNKAERPSTTNYLLSEVGGRGAQRTTQSSIFTALRELLPAPSRPWSLERRLGSLGTANGPGTRRRRSYEHQLDDHLRILAATGVQGELVAVDPSGRLREAAPARRAARPSAAILHASTIYPWELLHAPVSGRAPALYDLRRKVLTRVAWCRLNQPGRIGWALRQSTPRAIRKPGATRYLLPRRHWRAFFAWRRVVRELVALLLLLYAWWDRLSPARRAPSASAQHEQTGGASDPRYDLGTLYRDQSARGGGARALGDLLRGAM
jgi:hypothetical protein